MVVRKHDPNLQSSKRCPERRNDPGTGGFKTRPYIFSSISRGLTPLIGVYFNPAAPPVQAEADAGVPAACA